MFSGDALTRRRARPHAGEYPDFPASSARSGRRLPTLPEETRVLPGHGEEITVETAGKRFDSWVAGGPRLGDPAGVERWSSPPWQGMPRRLVPVHAHPAGQLAGLPAPVPDDLPRPPAAASGAAVGAQTASGASVHNALAGWWRLPLAERIARRGRPARGRLDRPGLR